MVYGRAFCFFLLSLMLFSCGGSSSEKPQQGKAAPPASLDERTQPSQPSQTPPASSPRLQARLANQLPEIKTARFQTEGNVVHAVVETADGDGDKVTLRYAWTVNDKKLDTQGDTISGLNRGDRVEAVITPNDGKQDGAPKGLYVIVANQPPKITPTQPQYSDPNWTLQIKASDPDGDPLEYSLLKAPSGMKIDPVSGLVTWNTDGVADGKYSATASVSDGHGGTSQYTFEITLAKQ